MADEEAPPEVTPEAVDPEVPTFPFGPEDWTQSPDAEHQIAGVPVDDSLVAPES